MTASAEFLWRLNRSYVNRLVRARNTLGLLEHVVLTRATPDAQAQLLPTVQFTRAYLARLAEAHHDWCYAYFYESAETKRMVQSGRAVQRALASFEQMRQQHGSRFAELAEHIGDLPRPSPSLTDLPSGDLWDMAQHALIRLAQMDEAE